MHFGKDGGMSKTPLQQLADHGQSPWIDYLAREFVHNGELERMVTEHGIKGVTSNPTIFQKAIAQGSEYDVQMQELLAERVTAPDVIFRMLAVRDIQDACDVLRPVWDETGGRDGFVSLEVSPRLAHDTEATAERVKLLWEMVDRPNLLVKIPATTAGLPAIEGSLAAGISINVTLIFSLERYGQVVEAFLRGIERLVESGGDPSRVASVASFFVSRVDTEVDKRLEAIGTPEALALRGKLAIANAKLAYQHYKQAFAGDRWERLAPTGVATQRCLWASTSVKNPAYRDVMYVEELIGPQTVNTMPPETIEAFEDHGVVADTLETGIEEARRLFQEIEAAGVDLEDVWRTLEDEGVQKFVDSFEELLEGVRSKRGELAAA
jgi:transaldolase